MNGFSLVKEGYDPIITRKDYEIGQIDSVDKRFDILCDVYVGTCFLEEREDNTALISLQLINTNELVGLEGLVGLERILFSARRGLNTYNKLLIDGGDIYEESLLQTGWEKKNGFWVVNTISADTCEECNERKATETFAESGLAFAHGQYQKLCEICLLTKQITECEKVAARLPELKARLEEIS